MEDGIWEILKMEFEMCKQVWKVWYGLKELAGIEAASGVEGFFEFPVKLT